MKARRFIALEEATSLIRKHFRVEPIGTEIISTSEAYGRILAEDVISPIDVPGFDRSKVDGYAVRSEDTFYADEHKPVTLKIIGNVKVGERPKVAVTRGSAVEISTGAPIPQGADSVVMLEYTTRSNGEVRIYRSVAPNENVFKKGSDIRANEVVLRKHKQISPREIGVLSAIGLTKVKVFKRPKVSLLSIGDELIEPGEKLVPAKIYDINRSTLRASIFECGCEPIDLGIARDDLGEIEDFFKRALATADVVIASGSTSAGIEDVLPDLLNKLGKPGVIVEGLRVKPGKPTIVAVIDEKIVFALPGHPSSALMIFDLLARPVLRLMRGLQAEPEVSTADAYTSTRIFSEKGRRTYVTVRLERDRSGKLVAHQIPKESGAITTLVRADGFIEIPEDREFIEEGEKVEVRLFS